MTSVLQEEPTSWKPIASMTVSDGRQYESKTQFNQTATYKINPIGSYIAANTEFKYIPKQNQLPKRITNITSLINQDLNKGFKQRNHLISKTDKFTNVLAQHFPEFDLIKSGIQFVSFRNNLNKIMAAPYFHSKPQYDAFGIDIIKKNGIIYLEIVDKSCILHNTPSNNDTNSLHNLKPEWWGQRFENISRYFPAINHSEHKESDNNDTEDKYELIILMQSQLNDHNLLMAAEIDCVDDEMEYVEIKTQKYIVHVPKTNKYHKYHIAPPELVNEDKRNNQSNTYAKHQRRDHNKNIRYHPYTQPEHKVNEYDGGRVRAKDPIIPWYKVLKIWIQSYLGGVNNIFIGFRDENGVVVDVNTLSLDYFRNKINYFDKKKKKKVSKGNVCLNFTDRVLGFIKQHCQSEDYVYRVVFNDPWKELILYSKHV